MIIHSPTLHTFSKMFYHLQPLTTIRTGLPQCPFIFRSYFTLPPVRICNCDSFDYGQSAFPSLSCTPFFPSGEERREQKDVGASSVEEISTSTRLPSIPDLCLYFHIPSTSSPEMLLRPDH